MRLSASSASSRPAPKRGTPKAKTFRLPSPPPVRCSSTKGAAGGSRRASHRDHVMKLQTHGKVLTAIVGSYPKPRYVYPRNGRSLLDSFGFAFERRREEIGSAEFASLLDRAALEAIKDLNQAGIDIVTDGEERRGHYVLHIVNRLEGVDARNLKPISMRAGTAQQNAPRVTGKLGYKGPLLLEEFLFTKKHAKRIAKIGLPGPTTVADCVADEYYR